MTVAVADGKRFVGSRAFLQSERVVTEELSGPTDKRQVPVEKNGVEMRMYSVFRNVSVDHSVGQLGRERNSK